MKCISKGFIVKTGMQDSVITETWTWKTEKETERRSEEHVFLRFLGSLISPWFYHFFEGEHPCALDASRRHFGGIISGALWVASKLVVVRVDHQVVTQGCDKSPWYVVNTDWNYIPGGYQISIFRVVSRSFEGWNEMKLNIAQFIHPTRRH